VSENIYTWKQHPKYKMYESVTMSKAKTELSETRALKKEQKYFEQFDFGILKVIDDWNPPELITMKEDKRLKYIDGDMNTWRGGSYIIGQNMIDKIGDTLEQYGIFLPLKVVDREETLYRYWVTNELECLNKEKSKIDKSWSSSLFRINKLVVNEEQYDGSMIFRIKDENYLHNDYFVSEEFIELIKKHDLKGFEFYKCNPGYTELYYGDDKDCKEELILIG